MPLLKNSSGQERAEDAQERRQQGRELPALIESLQAVEPEKRRWAARDLAGCPEAVDALCDRLEVEHDESVRQAILNALMRIGDSRVCERLTALLRSEDAALRNSVIEVMQNLPQVVAPYMERLLSDDDSDVRIFAVDILQVLQHENAPRWLLEVVERDAHVNVVGAALDRLAEIGTPDMVPALLSAR
ncbi:MAG: HEAT repeat domain-containing protein, partial [Gammaproteobacteria bacterium]|nr:HEAT repeat domain-containing protein [Gammaproteobacteria bacterium]